MATIFSRIRPEYEWFVSPNRPDGGLDFIGIQQFLQDATLDISAAVTVGGQCKKRTRVGTVVDEIAGSLTNMNDSVDPTFFVVAFSARVSKTRVVEAQRKIERAFRRHCHILDREQIEGLVCEHSGALAEVLTFVDPHDADLIATYFASRRNLAVPLRPVIRPMERVLAGVPFSIAVSVPGLVSTDRQVRLRWRPSQGTDDVAPVTVIGPLGVEGPEGSLVGANVGTDDLLNRSVDLEFVTHAVGEVDLGDVYLGFDRVWDGSEVAASLGTVQVIENIRPRFFERPFRSSLVRLEQEYDRVLAGAIASVGVVGVGGTGKSRLCQEFALERRRRGATVVAANQSKTLDDPNRVLSALFLALTPADIEGLDPANRVVQAVERFDRHLAANASPAIRSIFGSGSSSTDAISNQALISSLLLLITIRRMRAPLIIHLQDLHWCTPDILGVIGRLISQLTALPTSSDVLGTTDRYGVLVLLEGRVGELQNSGGDEWTSAPFESFLRGIEGPRIDCRGFGPPDGLDFVNLLFEDRHSARRLVLPELLDLQRELIEEIHRSAGGNPFHSLQQVQLLKEQGVIGQNQSTGLMFIVRPLGEGPYLPEAVFESIRLRWEYLRGRRPQVAILLWAASLLEDRLSGGLFRTLRDRLAPGISLAEIDAADMVWTGNSLQDDTVFRHENYFHALRRLDVLPEERELVVQAYVAWFASQSKLGPSARFRWAQTELAGVRPDMPFVRRLLRTASGGAERGGDLQLARRIAAMSLDLEWTRDELSPLPMGEFLRYVDREVQLVRGLLGSDRPEARRRLEAFRTRIRGRLRKSGGMRGWTRLGLHRRELVADMLYSELLFNEGEPDRAAAVAADVVRDVVALRPDEAESEAEAEEWDALQMEGHYALAVALALSGEIEKALQSSREAVDIAKPYRSTLASTVRSTHANILLAEDPQESEKLLRDCLLEMAARSAPQEERDLVEVDLAMALVVQAYQDDDEDTSNRLADAHHKLLRVFSGAHRLGHLADAAAAALMLGIISAVREDGDEAMWFAQAIGSSTRAGQAETLWRAQINLATSLYRREGLLNPAVVDHARSALNLMEESLSSYTHPDLSARIRLLWVPMAQAIRLLILGGDGLGRRALERYPALRGCFEDPDRGDLSTDRGGISSHEWIRVGEYDYVIF